MPEFYPPEISRSRPRAQDLERARRANQQAEYEHFARQTAMKDQLDQVVERIKQSHGSGMPEEFGQMMQVLMSMSMGPFHPPYPEVTMDAALAEFVRGRARALPGIHVSGDYPRMRDEVEIFDFTALVQGATRIRYLPKGDPESDDAPPTVEIWRSDTDVGDYLHGKVAEAFIGYLHYSGLFLVEAAKRPCPDCSDGPLRDCETCGGLRWIIPDEPAAAPPVAPARIDSMGRAVPRGLILHGDCLHDPPPVDDPALEEAAKEQWSDREAQTIQILLDSNLKMIAALQAVERWTHSDDLDALVVIRRLVDEALPVPPPGPVQSTDAHE